MSYLRGTITALLLASAVADIAQAEPTTEQIRLIQGVRYGLPGNSLFRVPPAANPFRYQFEYMQVVIKDRELFINCVNRYKAEPGDTVSVTYIPNDVRVNGKIVAENPAVSSTCPR
jgi:hypothetical protein